MRMAVFGVTATVLFAVSQVVASLVNARLAVHESYQVAGILYLTHVRNTGGIFGSFQGNSALFALVGVVLIAGLTYYLATTRPLALYQYVCFGLIAGAAASNVCDRLVYGAVVDYIDVRGIPYWHYVFNLADAAIHCGVWPLALVTLLRREDPHDQSPGSARPPSSSPSPSANT